ncbi:hypothetical protein EG329_014248 [Mollisiaceae sp. DMI_Dod_QoI]|nr:hypothetical protein EG329_014248 [Helotiales sp. DMI_Dod_QoI]
MAQVSQVQTNDGISWHVEQSGSGPHILLIPSGEGDCHCFTKLANLLSPNFTVTAFDLPCFSRTIAPHSTVENLSPYKIADQIVSLMDKLSIPSATVFGSSSGGIIAMAMLSKYDERVTRAIIHEVPLHVIPGLKAQAEAPVSENPKIIAFYKDVFANVMNEDKASWEALGEDYHERLEKNFITWVKNYSPVVDEMKWDKEELKAKSGRVNWTLGGLMPLSWFWENVVLATEVGIKIDVLNCKHFPQVSIPEVLAEYIRKCHVAKT